MIIYKNIFDNIKTKNIDFPVEDQFYANNNEGIIADGITRDPIGVSDLSSIPFNEMLKKYPRPSGGQLAAQTIVNSFANSQGTLFERLVQCNKDVKKLNNKYIKKCDYLENDYYGAVAACAKITDDFLDYAFICDCGVMILDKNCQVKFQTEDEKLLYSDPYIDANITSWSLPQNRVLVRSKYRNNLDTKVNSQCVSYGALTGEDTALEFIRSGRVKLEKEDLVVIYSDGFSEFFKLDEFKKLFINFDKNKFEKYVNEKASSDYKNYGKEKTIIILKG